MNYKIISYIIGWVLIFEAIFMAPALLTAMIYQEQAGYSLLLSMGLCLAVGLFLSRKKNKNKSMYAKEGFVTVALCWILLSAFGALPFVFAGETSREERLTLFFPSETERENLSGEREAFI